jgi:hypothetical protein
MGLFCSKRCQSRIGSGCCSGDASEHLQPVAYGGGEEIDRARRSFTNAFYVYFCLDRLGLDLPFILG